MIVVAHVFSWSPRMAHSLCALRVECGQCCHFQRPPTSFRLLLAQAMSRNRRVKWIALLPGRPCSLCVTIFHAATKRGCQTCDARGMVNNYLHLQLIGMSLPCLATMLSLPKGFSLLLPRFTQYRLNRLGSNCSCCAQRAESTRQ